jgi:hypothetical protein
MKASKTSSKPLKGIPFPCDRKDNTNKVKMLKKVSPSIKNKIRGITELKVPLVNITTAKYLETLEIPKPVQNKILEDNTIISVATRYKWNYSASTTSSNNNKIVGASSTKRTSNRTAIRSVLEVKEDQYKIENREMGFSWWGNDKSETILTQKEYNKSCKLMVNGFNGEINLIPIAGPNLAYAFVVPSMTQISLMSAFKTTPNQMLLRQRMTELSSMKTCYYHQLHWKRGSGNSSHINESNWKDSPLLDPTTSIMLESYISTLTNSLTCVTGWNTSYQTLCSVIETDRAGHQAPHLDDKGCLDKEEKNRPFILHHPLCEEGSTLQIWLPNNKGTNSPSFVHIPFGTAMVLRGDVLHAGSYGTKGNIRFHAHLAPQMGTAEGKELGIVNKHCDERLRESDIAADLVNDLMLKKNKEHSKFTSKYIKRMKQVLSSPSFWDQCPEKNVSGKPRRQHYS